ncbi:ATP synthase subunit I [Desulfuromonas sp. AOP6]|uniref:ATP synthase subunit I n=1 Tax=Desulfuromonas sp. AOP6 TaxID=1566351 RepID=UPI001271D7E8|nr:ATP synthase subunit I [Desulfuromonas sp. AOP6]BCA78346.1 hypothetical protein AOP6_0133 [Desulfuromonas sp. AOP6]
MNEDSLLRDLSRRNWLILGILVVLSGISASPPIILGVLTGGIVAISGFHWLHFSLKKLIGDPQQHSTRGFKLSYVIRLGALATALVVLIVIFKVHPVGLALGLSVVVINIIWTTLKRSF